MWKTFSHGHILSTAGDDLRVFQKRERVSKERKKELVLGGSFKHHRVLWWLLDQLSRCITSGSHFLKPPRPGTDPAKNIFVIPTLRTKSAETWKVQELEKPPEKESQLFIENWRFFEGFENTQNQRFFAFAVLKYKELTSSLILIFFSKYLGLAVLWKSKENHHTTFGFKFQLPL